MAGLSRGGMGACPKGIYVSESFYPLWGIGVLEGVT